MKRKSDNTFRIWSLLMILSGICGIALDVYLMILRFKAAEVSRFFVLVAALIMLGYAVCEITAGVKGLAFAGQRSRGRRFRAAEAKISAFKKLALSVIILCLVELILSLIFGIILWQLAVMVVFGIVIPLIYMTASKSLQS